MKTPITLILSLALILFPIRCSAQTFMDYFNKADSCIVAGNFDDALLNFEMCIDANPGFSKAYYGRGLCLMHFQDFKTAIKNFEKSNQQIHQFQMALSNHHNLSSSSIPC